MIGSPAEPAGKVAPGVVLALVAGLFLPSQATAEAGGIERVSVAADGTQGDSVSGEPSVSADGRYVAFLSAASNLVPGDTNARDDVFVHDRHTAANIRVSVRSDGSQACACPAAGTGGQVEPAISADGNRVAFESTAALVAGDTNGEQDIFVHDLPTRTTTRVSVASDGTQGNERSYQPSISADGRYVAFTSRADNLVPGDTNGPRNSSSGDDVFVHDRSTATTTRVSVSSLGTEATGVGGSSQPSISANGRYVAFQSGAPNLVIPDQTSTGTDVFVHDRQSGATTLVHKASDGTQANATGSGSAISADGRYVAFLSLATNLVVGDNNGAADVFVHDRDSSVTTLVHKASDGTQANGAATATSISGDGRHVAVASSASNLVTGDTNTFSDVFVHDRQTGANALVSRASPAQPANNSSRNPAISGDGAAVAFVSGATNLVPDDTNGLVDVFVSGIPEQLPVVSVGSVAVHEGDTGTRAATFTVTLAHPSAAAVTVAYATATGSAVGSDYTPKAGTLTFPPGATSVTVKVPVTGDASDEPDEAFTLDLSSPTGAVVGDGTGVGTILDDDPGTGRRVGIGDVSVHEGDSGSRSAVFTVSLSKASTSYVTVNFATAKSTATTTDYTARTGTLSFPPGTTSSNVKVPITPDVLREGTEHFTVNLSGASGATISDPVGLGTIVDFD